MGGALRQALLLLLLILLLLLLPLLLLLLLLPTCPPAHRGEAYERLRCCMCCWARARQAPHLGVVSRLKGGADSRSDCVMSRRPKSCPACERGSERSQKPAGGLPCAGCATGGSRRPGPGNCSGIQQRGALHAAEKAEKHMSAAGSDQSLSRPTIGLPAQANAAADWSRARWTTRLHF